MGAHMFSRLTIILFFIGGLLRGETAHANCSAEQLVEVKAGELHLATWRGTSDEVHAMALPNNFLLGLKVEQASRERHQAYLKQTKSTTAPALLRISVYDLSTDKPRLMTQTFGGVNSLQGYSPRGGADRVDEVGEPGITLRLHKQTCLDEAQIAALPTAAALNLSVEQVQPNAQQLNGKAAAQADVAQGKVFVSYNRGALSDAEIAIVKSEVEKNGLQFKLRDESGDPATRGFARGYDTAMLDAVIAKLGEVKSRELERSIKARTAKLKQKKAEDALK